MEIFGLDKDFGLVTADIPYFNLQWSRKYYEPGDFSLQVSAEVYDGSWAYIMTNDRPEVGLVQKLSYTNDGGERLVQLSGFFAEKLLDDFVAVPRFTGDFATTEAAVKGMFDGYRVHERKGITWRANSPLLGNRTQCDFLGDSLAAKWSGMLETREMSYRVHAVNGFTALEAFVWQGLDRTQSQTANPWCVFSTDFGNVVGESVDIDDSAHANVCIVTAADESVTFEVDVSGGAERREMWLDKGSESYDSSKWASEDDWRDALKQEALEALAGREVSQEIDVTAYGDAGYMVDYDLGDKVTIQLPDIGLALEARIVEVSEVFKPEGHEVSLGFGSKRISNIERAVRA